MMMGLALSRCAQRHPHKTALIFEDRSWTYAQFNARVNRLAGALAAWGLTKGDRLAVMAENGNEYLEIYHAAAKLGVWMVPINHRLKAPEAGFRLEHSQATSLILGPRYLWVLEQMPPAARKAIGRRVLVLDPGPFPAGTTSYEQALEMSGEAEPQVDIHPEDILFIGYTGGTTGRAKGALISNRAIMVGHLHKIIEYGLDQHVVTLNPGPFWHTAPRNFSHLALYLGGTTVVMRSFDPIQYLRLLARHRVTLSFLVPTMFAAILETAGHQDYDTSSLRALLSGGSPLPTPLKEAALGRFGPILHEFYAATETLILTSINAGEIGLKRRSVGRPVRDVYLRLLNDNGQEVPAGQVGEVYLKCPSLFSGYYRDQERTRQAFRGSWFSLGDMGRLDDDGYLYLVDRKTDMVISGGENIYPSEVEEVLLRHPRIAEAAVIGVPDSKWGESLKALVVLKNGQRADPQEIMDFCQDKLADYLKPRSVEFVEALPRSPVGKVLKRELRQRYWGQREFMI
ncbi:MAG: hypothetical protein C4525_14045 [Desulfarculus sp.]|jgi:acyl-CoA synthetase (AMP-forming)/AMP-acid ligase II|nr:MAG: hypothetical protein C4525_14045 [Desulfarculus sp.]